MLQDFIQKILSGNLFKKLQDCCTSMLQTNSPFFQKGVLELLSKDCKAIAKTSIQREMRKHDHEFVPNLTASYCPDFL